MLLMFLKWVKYGANKEDGKQKKTITLICSLTNLFYDLLYCPCVHPTIYPTVALKSDCAPSILITFINMMLLSYDEDSIKPPSEKCRTAAMYGEDDYSTQVKTLN